MDRLGFIGGAYTARSVIASAQRSINYFPEINPKDSSFPITLYQRPGLRKLATAPNGGPWRALYQASTGIGFGVAGQWCYRIYPDWSMVPLGKLASGRTNICSFTDNGSEAVVVDGSINGWTFDPSDGLGWNIYTDPTGSFFGADKVDTLDTFILWNKPNTPFFASTLSNTLIIDPLYFAGKVAYPDNLMSLWVNRREILLFGKFKSEVWYNAGNAIFPFAELPGAYIEHGLAALYSLASSDISVFWLGRDLQGQGIVWRQRGYQTTRISNHGVEYAIRKIAETVGIDDAIGYCYQQDGHIFYVLTFPKGDQTWVFDDAVGVPDSAWHQRSWTDLSRNLHRERANCYASLYGTNVVGDWENGDLYALDPQVYTDEVNGRKGPISFIRGFPHLLAGQNAAGQTLPSHGRTVHHQAFWLALEAGTDPTQDVGRQLSLRWSDNWGKSWGNDVLQSAGEEGEYSTLPQWPGTGLARFRIYEVSHSIPSQVAINGAWVMGRIQEQNR